MEHRKFCSGSADFTQAQAEGEVAPQIRTVRQVEFLPDSGHACARESGAAMSRRPRRNHSAAFKAKVALAAIKGDRTLAQLADEFSSPEPDHGLEGTVRRERSNCFRAGRRRGPGGAGGRYQGLHAKIGELTLENGFLEGALSKADC